MPSSSVPEDRTAEAVTRSDVSAGEPALRYLSALTQLTEAMPVDAGSHVDISHVARVVGGAVPGIDLMATWFVGRNELTIRYHSARIIPGPAPVSLSFSSSEQGTLATGPLTATPAADNTAARLVNRVRGALKLRSVALLPVNRSDRHLRGLLIFGSLANRPFSRVEVAFLEAVAAQVARRLEAERARRSAERERARLEAVIATLPEALIMVDQSGRLVSASKVTADLFGGEGVEGALGSVLAPLLPRAAGQLEAGCESPVGLALAGETVRSHECTIPTVDGHERHILVSAGPLRDSDGAIAGAVLLLQDVTKLKELDRLKDEFINTVSHELRTPTTTIRGGALTLLKREAMLSNEVRRQLLQDIADESERLHHLVEDLLTLSRSRAGMQLTPEPLRLHRVVNKVILGLGGRLGNHPLAVDVPPDLPMADADPIALEQVLRNLIENAARHSPSGSKVEIAAALRNRQLLISIRDHGPGIPPEDRERVFEPFARLPRSVHAATQGAGLGLAVCRRLVEMASGRIWVEAAPEGGTVFCFSVAVAPDAEE